ncbi:hypothetical protein RRG08_000509 [Elysia crispata]|uniref:Uncharacterized protein n=1 Tax=Elysia crispata TaxID=231223 RepID=A0AAE0YC35_9GAST|nr:hypothetical protein RRG08_000509 [Elysia crispata]
MLNGLPLDHQSSRDNHNKPQARSSPGTGGLSRLQVSELDKCSAFEMKTSGESGNRRKPLGERLKALSGRLADLLFDLRTFLVNFTEKRRNVCDTLRSFQVENLGKT